MTWSGSIAMEPGRLVFAGSLGATQAHAHAAVQILVVDSGTVELTDRSGVRRTASAAVIPAGARHAISAPHAVGLMMYLDPASSAGRALTALVEPNGRDDLDSWTAAAAAVSTLDGTGSPADDVLRLLVGDGALPRPVAACHPSVRAAAELLPQLVAGPIAISQIACQVGLSADRLGRLFSEQLGLSFSAYVRWTRLTCAIGAVEAGATLTDAAHAAGFTDSSHLNRVFHEMFGIGPSVGRSAITSSG